MENRKVPWRERIKPKEHTRKILAWGVVGCLLGLLAVLVALYIEVHLHTTTSLLGKVGIEFLKHIGIALLVLGLVGIILDFRDWREYFQERLAEIVVKKSYLTTLDRSQLISLQTDTLKAFFKAEDIDRKGSFLDYFHSKIRDFIGSPYREDINNIMVLAPTDEDDGYLVKDHLSYTCRKVGESIQPRVRWSIAREDIHELRDIRFTLVIPQSLFHPDDFANQYPGIEKPRVIVEQKDLTCEGECYEFNLMKYKDVDGLRVSIDAEYVVRRDAFFSWSFTLPSKGLALTIQYPSQLELAVEFFGMGEDEDLDINPQNGLYSMRHSSWVLPDSGLAWQLRAKRILEESKEELIEQPAQ